MDKILQFSELDKQDSLKFFIVINNFSDKSSKLYTLTLMMAIHHLTICMKKIDNAKKKNLFLDYLPISQFIMNNLSILKDLCEKDLLLSKLYRLFSANQVKSEHQQSLIISHDIANECIYGSHSYQEEDSFTIFTTLKEFNLCKPEITIGSLYEIFYKICGKTISEWQIVQLISFYISHSKYSHDDRFSKIKQAPDLPKIDVHFTELLNVICTLASENKISKKIVYLFDNSNFFLISSDQTKKFFLILKELSSTEENLKDLCNAFVEFAIYKQWKNVRNQLFVLYAMFIDQLQYLQYIDLTIESRIKHGSINGLCCSLVWSILSLICNECSHSSLAKSILKIIFKSNPLIISKHLSENYSEASKSLLNMYPWCFKHLLCFTLNHEDNYQSSNLEDLKNKASISYETIKKGFVKYINYIIEQENIFSQQQKFINAEKVLGLLKSLVEPKLVSQTILYLVHHSKSTFSTHLFIVAASQNLVDYNTYFDNSQNIRINFIENLMSTILSEIEIFSSLEIMDYNSKTYISAPFLNLFMHFLSSIKTSLPKQLNENIDIFLNKCVDFLELISKRNSIFKYPRANKLVQKMCQSLMLLSSNNFKVTPVQIKNAFCELKELCRPDDSELFDSFCYMLANQCQYSLCSCTTEYIYRIAQIFSGLFISNFFSNVVKIDLLQMVQYFFSSTPTDQTSTFAIKLIGHLSDEIQEFPSLLEFLATSQNFQALEGSVQKKLSSILKVREETSIIHTNTTKTLEPKIDQKFMSKLRRILNSLTALTIKQKNDEFDQLFDQQLESLEQDEEALKPYFVSAVSYIICQRCADEPDCQTLYLKIITYSKYSKTLLSLSQSECIGHIKEILAINRSNFDSIQKRKLENLGELLVRMTLLNNIPILHQELPIDALLNESFLKGVQEVEIIVPFITKMLKVIPIENSKNYDSSSNSSSIPKEEENTSLCIFSLPNPWTLSIIQIIGEIYHSYGDSLKTTVQTTIENLYEKYDLNLKKLSSTILSNISYNENAKLLPNQAINILFGKKSKNLNSEPDIDIDMTKLNDNLIMSSYIHVATQIPELKEVIFSSLKSAISVIIKSIAKKVLSTLFATCVKLTRKDFSIFVDQKLTIKNALYLSNYLSKNLVLVACDDVFLDNLSIETKKNLNDCFVITNRNMNDAVDQMIISVIHKNLSIVISFIQEIVKVYCTKSIENYFLSIYDFSVAYNYNTEVYLGLSLSKLQNLIPDSLIFKENIIEMIYRYADQMSKKIEVMSTESTDQNKMNVQNLTDIEINLYNRIKQIYEDILFRYPELKPYQQNIPSTLIPITKLFESINRHFQAPTEESGNAFAHYSILCLLENIENPSQYEAISSIHTFVLNVLKSLIGSKFAVSLRPNTIILCMKQMPPQKCMDVNLIDMLLRNQLILPTHYDSLLKGYFDSSCVLNFDFILSLFKRIFIDNPIAHISFENDFRQVSELLHDYVNSDQQGSDIIHRFLIHLKQKLSLNPSEASNSPQKIGNQNALSETIDKQKLSPEKSNQRSKSPPTDGFNSSDGVSCSDLADDLLREWILMFHSSDTPNSSYSNILNSNYHLQNLSKFINKLIGCGMLKCDQKMSFFFKKSIESCVKDSLVKLSAENIGKTIDGVPIQIDQANVFTTKNKCFYVLDGLVGFIALLIKYSGDRATLIKLSMLHKILTIIVNCLINDASEYSQKLKLYPEKSGNSVMYPSLYFNGLPYFRILFMLFVSLHTPDNVFDSISTFLLTAYGNSLLNVAPTKVPLFAFFYLELIGNRIFIEKSLADYTEDPKNLKCSNMYARLLSEMLKFLSQFMAQREIPKPILTMYKALLRLLLVLLHDFPNFICDYYFTFCENIATNAIQLRNLILSAFPRSVVLPCPFSSNRHVEFLKNLNHTPRIVHNYAKILTEMDLNDKIIAFLSNPSSGSKDFTTSNSNSLAKIVVEIFYNYPEKSSLNTSTINAFAIFVGNNAVESLKAKVTKETTLSKYASMITEMPHFSLFISVLCQLNDEGKYLLVGAMANHLRYPNTHTHYFSQLLLSLFLAPIAPPANNGTEVKEIITRVLLERLTVSRPHPWGLLVTFIDLLRRPVYRIWSHDFVSYTPEIRKLFDCIAKTLIVRDPKSSGDSSKTSSAANSDNSSINKDTYH